MSGFPQVEAVIACPVLRWACSCGRFIDQQGISSTDYLDPLGTYYGIRSETQFHCSQCGLVQGEPRLTQVGWGAFVLDRFAGEAP